MNKYLNTYFKYRERTNFEDLQSFEVKFLPENKQSKIIQDKPQIIGVYEEPPIALQNLVIEKDIDNIVFINKPSKEIIKKVLSRYPGKSLEEILYSMQENLFKNYRTYEFKYIKNIFRDIQFKLIEKGYYNIEYIRNPHYDVQMNVVEIKPFLIKYIDNPHYDVQMKAVEKIPLTIGIIKDPHRNVQMKVIEKEPSYISLIKDPHYDVQMKAVEIKPIVIMNIDNPHYDVQMKAVEKDRFYIEYIKNPHPDVKKKAEEMRLN